MRDGERTLTADEINDVRTMLHGFVTLSWFYHRRWAHTMGITQCNEVLCRTWRDLAERLDAVVGTDFVVRCDDAEE